MSKPRLYRFNGAMERRVEYAQEQLTQDDLEHHLKPEQRDSLQNFVMAGMANLQLRSVIDELEAQRQSLERLDEFVGERKQAYDQPPLPRRAMNWVDDNPRLGYPAVAAGLMAPPAGMAGIIYLLVEYVLSRGG